MSISWPRAWHFLWALVAAIVLYLIGPVNAQAQTGPFTPQAVPDVVATGNVAATNAAVGISLNGDATCAVQVNGNFTGALTPRYTADNGLTWQIAQLTPFLGGAQVQSITAPGFWFTPCTGANQFQLLGSSWTSGTANIVLHGAAAPIDSATLSLLNSVLNVAIPNGVAPANGSVFTMQGTGTNGAVPTFSSVDPCSSVTKTRFDISTSAAGWSRGIAGTTNQFVHICGIIVDANGGNVSFGQAASGGCATAATISGPWTFNATNSQGFVYGNNASDTAFGTTTVSDDWCVDNLSAVQLTIHGTYVSTNP